MNPLVDLAKRCDGVTIGSVQDRQLANAHRTLFTIQDGVITQHFINVKFDSEAREIDLKDDTWDEVAIIYSSCTDSEVTNGIQASLDDGRRLSYMSLLDDEKHTHRVCIDVAGARKAGCIIASQPSSSWNSMVFAFSCIPPKFITPVALITPHPYRLEKPLNHEFEILPMFLQFLYWASKTSCSFESLVIKRVAKNTPTNQVISAIETIRYFYQFLNRHRHGDPDGYAFDVLFRNLVDVLANSERFDVVHMIERAYPRLTHPVYTSLLDRVLKNVLEDDSDQD